MHDDRPVQDKNLKHGRKGELSTDQTDGDGHGLVDGVRGEEAGTMGIPHPHPTG